jgi:hypothetical protein
MNQAIIVPYLLPISLLALLLTAHSIEAVSPFRGYKNIPVLSRCDAQMSVMGSSKQIYVGDASPKIPCIRFWSAELDRFFVNPASINYEIEGSSTSRISMPAPYRGQFSRELSVHLSHDAGAATRIFSTDANDDLSVFFAYSDSGKYMGSFRTSGEAFGTPHREHAHNDETVSKESNRVVSSFRLASELSPPTRIAAFAGISLMLCCTGLNLLRRGYPILGAIFCLLAATAGAICFFGALFMPYM